MRGPLVRIKYDIRRHWKCPKCGYKRRAHASKTTIRCHCEKEGPFMKLVESQRKVRPPAEELDNYIEFEDVDESQKSSSSDETPDAKSEKSVAADTGRCEEAERKVSHTSDDADTEVDDSNREVASSEDEKHRDESPNAE